MPRLIAIELEKFQTISNPTIIPIRNLTLMFGPNGAGKSSIFDALELMGTLFSDNWGKGNKNLIDYLDRWARKENSESSGNEIGFGLQVIFEEKWQPDYFDLDKTSSLKHIAINSMGSGGDYENSFKEKNFRFFIKFNKSEGIFGQWLISSLVFENDDGKILEVEKTEMNSSRLNIYNIDWIDITQLIRFDKEPSSVIKFYRAPFFSIIIDTRLDCLNPNYWLNNDDFTEDSKSAEIQSYLALVGQQVINFFKVIFTHHLFTPNRNNLPLVKASRSVPTRNEVTSLVEGKHYQDKDKTYRPELVEESTTLKAIESSLNKLESHWAYLSNEIAVSLAKESIESIHWDELDPIKKINYMLREDLFIDNGYQLTGDVLCLTSIEEITDTYLIHQAIHYPKIVRLFLTDQKQRKVEIEDVGSGIGYLLPVLASLAHDGTTLVQQPELHLHPALQSALGDSIVRCVEHLKYYDQFVLIETHSEHILLRILKLIKNSSLREEEVISPLTFEKISILYFEPLPDGSTKVRHLRVSPEGRLIDRWPGGFFTERYKDLFDDE